MNRTNCQDCGAQGRLPSWATDDFFAHALVCAECHEKRRYLNSDDTRHPRFESKSVGRTRVVVMEPLSGELLVHKHGAGGECCQ